MLQISFFFVLVCRENVLINTLVYWKGVLAMNYEIETCAAVMIFSVLAYTEESFFPLQKMFPMNQELFDRCLDVCKDE